MLEVEEPLGRRMEALVEVGDWLEVLEVVTAQLLEAGRGHSWLPSGPTV